MRISELATQSRKRLADKRLADTSILQRMLDEAIIDAHIACADCGKRQVDDAAVLARIPNINLYSEEGARGGGPYVVRPLGRTASSICMSEFEFATGTRIKYLEFEEKRRAGSAG